jgi:hypothetical protein
MTSLQPENKENKPLDLAPITRHLRAMAGSRLLVCAVHHIPVFEVLSQGPLPVEDLRQKLGLKERPAMVLFPALCAMGLMAFTPGGSLGLTGLGHYLTETCQPNLIGYTGLDKNDPGVREMAQRLKMDGPPDPEQGVAYVKDQAAPSPMDDPKTARFLTLALAGRARFLSPLVASQLPQGEQHLLDVAGGTGYYSYEWLLRNPKARATVFDRPEVLKVARELLADFCRSGHAGAEGVAERVDFVAGDMLTDPLPPTDLLLAASLFHDWPPETCTYLARKFAGALQPGGELWVHDSFLDDSLDGPLAVTDYSAVLFMVTKGRAYSRKEYRTWFSEAGLETPQKSIPTLMDYGLIYAQKPV